MAGEHQMRRGVADAGVEILHVVGTRLAEGHAMHGEAGGLQRRFEKLERAAFRRRHRAAAQQIAGKGDGIGGHSVLRLQSLSSSLMLVLERVRSSTRLTMTAQ